MKVDPFSVNESLLQTYIWKYPSFHISNENWIFPRPSVKGIFPKPPRDYDIWTITEEVECKPCASATCAHQVHVSSQVTTQTNGRQTGSVINSVSGTIRTKQLYLHDWAIKQPQDKGACFQRGCPALNSLHWKWKKKNNSWNKPKLTVAVRIFKHIATLWAGETF